MEPQKNQPIYDVVWYNMTGISDFRSDTTTRPTPGMIKAMSTAPLGDDVLGDDPSVLELQERTADLLGKESALFVPSGTMSNLIAIYLHVKPGEEMLCDENAHLYIYEQAGYAQINGVSVRCIPGERGIFDVQQLQNILRGENLHFPTTKAITLENTHNRGGGSIWPLEKLKAVCSEAKKHGLGTHLDGARLMNAAIASGVSPRELSAPFDTVSLCFSKGLGTPAGSILLGPRDWMRTALRRRKVLGGGMRQVGILASAALYVLDNHIERMEEDHELARYFAGKIRGFDPRLIRLKYETIETNMVFFDICSDKIAGAAREKSMSPSEWFVAELARLDVKMLPMASHTVRAVTHLDVGKTDADAAIAAIAAVLKCDAQYLN